MLNYFIFFIILFIIKNINTKKYKKTYFVNLIDNKDLLHNRIKKKKKIKLKIKDLINFDFDKKINVAIFGSTGCIGSSSLSIIKECNLIKNVFNVYGIYANKNVNKLYEQAKEFLPKYICIHDETKYDELKKLIKTIKNYEPTILIGNEGMIEICKDKNVDKIINAVDSFQGLYSTIHAIKNEKIIGLANKESIVSAAEYLKKLLKKHKNSYIIPVDSEHNAIFQCLNNFYINKKENNLKKKNKFQILKCLEKDFAKKNQIHKIFLFSSGGPFQNLEINELKNVTSKDALKHPKWNMGKKITIDSSSMMNKGLELIEAHYLFDVDYDNIEIVVNKECIIHSCVEFQDKSTICQMSYPDMRIAILYSLSFPFRIKNNLKSLDFFEIQSLSFSKPCLNKFPNIKLAYEAGKKKNFFPTVLNSSNEVANDLFLNDKIGYFNISDIIKEVLDSFKPQKLSNNADDLMNQIYEIHNWSKQKAMEIYNKRYIR